MLNKLHKFNRFFLLICIAYSLSSCSFIKSQQRDELAILINPTTIQEDSWQFRYTTVELPGSTIRDDFDVEYRAAGQWAVINFETTNTSSKKQEVFLSIIESGEFILITSDGKKWEYPKELYNYRVITVQPEQSYNLKLAFDIPVNLTPKTLIYQFYDEDYNTLEFQISLQ